MNTTQQQVMGASTTAAPAVTCNDKNYFLAWIEPDQSLWWTTSPATAKQDTFNFEKPKKIIDAASSEGPSLNFFAGKVWMAWKGEGTDARIFLASLDGSTWSAGAPITGVGTSSSPAMAVTESVLYLAHKGESDNRIYFSKSSDGKTWSADAAIEGALTSDAPALVGYGGTVYLGFKGASDDSLWLATYTEAKGWGTAVQLPYEYFASSNGPALAVGNTGNLHIAWKWANFSAVQSVMISPGTVIDSSTSWPAWDQAAIVQTSARPALASQPSANTYMMLALKGNGQDVWVGSLDGLLSIQPYTFRFVNFEILNTRSGNILSTSKDTDYASFSVTVGNGQPQVKTQSMGNLSNGTYYPTNLYFPSVNVADSDKVIVTYHIINSSIGEEQATAYLQQATEKLASIAATAAVTYAGAALGAAIGAALGLAIPIPLLGSALGALVGWLVGSVWGVAFPDCDGPVAARVRVYTGADLRAATALNGGQNWTENNPGVNSPDGCGSNSNYDVEYSVTRE